MESIRFFICCLDVRGVCSEAYLLLVLSVRLLIYCLLVNSEGVVEGRRDGKGCKGLRDGGSLCIGCSK
jgi:hypothetical protein